MTEGSAVKRLGLMALLLIATMGALSCAASTSTTSTASPGVPTAVVPDLVGLTPYDATHQLDLLGLQVQTQGSADPWAGRVDRQSPLAGSIVARGSTVMLFVSAGATTSAAPTTTTVTGT